MSDEKSNQNECVLFMTAYHFDYKKNKKSVRHKKHKVDRLFQKYHVEAIATKSAMITPAGKLRFSVDYDYDEQIMRFDFPESCEDNNDDYQVIMDKMGWVLKLLHSTEMLLNDQYSYDIDLFSSMESFLVTVNSRLFQVDSRVFMFEDIALVVYELIDYETSLSLRKDDVCGRKNNYNIQHATNIMYFTDRLTREETRKISDIIIENYMKFLIEICGLRYTYSSYTYLHNILLITQSAIDPERYLLDVMGIDHLDSSIKNLSSQNTFQYYSVDGMGLVVVHEENVWQQALYDCQLFELLKMLVLIKQILCYDLGDGLSDSRDIINRIYYIITQPSNTIATSRVVYNIQNLQSYKMRQKAIELKLEYLGAKHEQFKRKNALFLNIILCVLTFLSGIGSLKIICEEFSLNFTKMFFGFVLLFAVFVALWYFRERK